jgi:endonuclease G
MDLSEIPDGGMPMDGSVAEAIIIVDQNIRPALIVRNNAFEQPALPTWKTLLNANRTKLERALLSVGRLELVGHPTLPYAGTAWMIGDGRLAVTNRHVGAIFARKQGSSFQFVSVGGVRLQAKVDFREEFNVPKSMEIVVEKVLFISPPGDGEPDVAILKLSSHSRLPDPIPLFDGAVKKAQNVAVIGYPASDPRNPASALSTVFGDVFEVKRLAPGLVTRAPSGFTFQHDCSTLGGNSGSVVVDIATGHAVGLHFGGRFRQANFAVTAERLKKILGKLKVQVAVPIGMDALEKPKKPKKPSFAGRDGYLENFLGPTKALRVPVPKLNGGRRDDLTKVKGTKDHLLRYRHFSIAMSASRRLCHFTAVNIDGDSSINIRRANDVWNLDPRIPESAQIGNELYAGNDLDRGHMVRRLDPVWGQDAKQANDDTFVYTNATPQHARLNQRTWNDLEDYILTNTDAHDLRVNVFTGPVFDDGDPEYRGVQLPQQFWKVVTVVNGDTGKLHATAYVLSQKDLITDLEFVFGQFRTYQLPIAELEERTGLDFGKLSNFDPLKDQETFAIREISKLEEVVL